MRFAACLTLLCILPFCQGSDGPLLDGNGQISCITTKMRATAKNNGLPPPEGDNCKIYKGTKASCPCPCGCAHYKAWDGKGKPSYEHSEVVKCLMVCGARFDGKGGCWSSEDCVPHRMKVDKSHGDSHECPCCSRASELCQY